MCEEARHMEVSFTWEVWRHCPQRPPNPFPPASAAAPLYLRPSPRAAAAAPHPAPHM